MIVENQIIKILIASRRKIGGILKWTNNKVVLNVMNQWNVLSNDTKSWVAYWISFLVLFWTDLYGSYYCMWLLLALKFRMKKYASRKTWAMKFGYIFNYVWILHYKATSTTSTLSWTFLFSVVLHRFRRVIRSRISS